MSIGITRMITRRAKRTEPAAQRPVGHNFPHHEYLLHGTEHLRTRAPFPFPLMARKLMPIYSENAHTFRLGGVPMGVTGELDDSTF